MPTWVMVCIWIVYSAWSYVEIKRLITVLRHNKTYEYEPWFQVRYTKAAAVVTAVWLVAGLFWIAYNIFG